MRSGDEFSLRFTLHDKNRKQNHNGEERTIKRGVYAGLTHDKFQNGTIGVNDLDKGRIVPVHILLIKDLNGGRVKP